MHMLPKQTRKHQVGLQVGHVPRRKESIYVCAAAPAAIMEAPRSTPGLCAGEASAAPTPSIQVRTRRKKRG